MRVPLDFSWPLRKPWSGYINPHYKDSRDCPFCLGEGLNEATVEISRAWYNLDGDRSKRWCHNITQDEVEALVKAGRLKDFTHEIRGGGKWEPKDPPVMPTAAEVNAWSRNGMGHDGINRWICVETRARRLGVWGKCWVCKASGTIWRNNKSRRACKAWTKTQPPEGDGYQMWETVSEGSPISPVFPSAEGLAEYLALHDDSVSGPDPVGRWLRFINGPGWAPSMISNGRTLMSGVEGVTE